MCVCVWYYWDGQWITHQDTERIGSMAWEKWKLTWVTLFQLGVSGKSGIIHSYRNFEHRNTEQSLMEECKYQALTVDLTLKSSWTWTIFLSVSSSSRSTWIIALHTWILSSFSGIAFKSRSGLDTFYLTIWTILLTVYQFLQDQNNMDNINFFKIKDNMDNNHSAVSTLSHSSQSYVMKWFSN